MTEEISNPSAWAVQLEGVEVRLGESRALNEVALSAARGEVVAIMGPSGGGKSTLLRAIVGLETARPGVVRGRISHRLRDGRRLELGAHPAKGAGVSGPPARRILARAGATLVLQCQQAGLEPGRRLAQIFDGVAALRLSHCGRPERRSAIQRALQEQQLPNRILSASGETLSGGMALRVMLALSTLGEPQLLLLDEPTGGLDSDQRRQVLQGLRASHHRGGWTGLVVTHDEEVAQGLADRVLWMETGRLEPRRTAAPFVPRIVEMGGRMRPESEFLVDIQGVSRRFGTETVLEDISMGIGEGETVAVLGPSGSGKSTLGRIIAGLDRPDAGELFWQGRARAMSRRARAHMLFQNPYTSLNPAQTALDAVAEVLRLHHRFPPRAARKEARGRLQALGLTRRDTSCPSAQLSGGQRRRVALARALVGPSALLVLDEPTANLDGIHRRDVIEALQGAQQQDPNRSWVLITHDSEVVGALADRAVVLDKGRLVRGPISEDRSPGVRPGNEAAGRRPPNALKKNEVGPVMGGA